MEDTMACLTDAFSVVSGSNGASTTNSPPELLLEERRPESGSAVGSQTAAAAATGTVPAVALGTAATLAKTAAMAITKATSTAPTGTPEAASYFGLFDGAYVQQCHIFRGRCLWHETTLRCKQFRFSILQ